MVSARVLSRAVIVAAAAAGVAGCGAYAEDWDPDQSELDVANVDSEIIGGSSVSIAVRRARGLIDVNNNCSGALVAPDWVLTASHCLNFAGVSGNLFHAPREDGTRDTRRAISLSNLGGTDTALVQLQPVTASMTWPNVTRAASSVTPRSLVGLTLTCYGRGTTTYETPSGLSGFGVWRRLSRSVSSLTGGLFIMDATTAGSEITAPGDSGAVCVYNNQAAAVTSHGWWDCADRTSENTCRSTITRVTQAGFVPTAPFADYINAAPSRAATMTFRPVPLQNAWNNASLNTTNVGANVTSGIVQLRGAIDTHGSNAVPFTLIRAYRPPTDIHVPVTLCSGAKGRLHIQPNGVATVEAEGGFSDASCFTSLEGVSYSLTTGGFKTLALENGWTHAPFATRNAEWRNMAGIVRLRGAIATSGSNQRAFTLPSEARPSADVYVNVDLCNAAKGRLRIRPNGAVTVSAESDFSDAQCMTSLEGVSFAVDATGFTPLTLQNGWTHAPNGTRNAAVTNDGGVVRFQGAIATSGSSTTAFTLPVTFRPASNVYVAADLCDGSKGRILIQPNGNVSILPRDASPTQCQASLEGVSYGL